ncbi:MAG: DUF4340 domain-containing protein [Chloroflexi bacterium]|nr:DUF4340 domain-containing protein [Chloroflexota bacterium]
MLRRNTWIVLGVFLVLLIVLFIMQRQPEMIEVVPNAPAVSQTLLSIAGEDVHGIRVAETNGEAVVFELGDDELWAFVEPETLAEETNADDILAAVTQLSNLRILSQLDSQPSMEAMGLDEPAFTITLRLEDDGEMIIYVGDETQMADGYYVQLEDEGPVVVAKFALGIVLDLLHEPPLAPTPTPEISTETPESEQTPTELSTEESNSEP